MVSGATLMDQVIRETATDRDDTSESVSDRTQPPADKKHLNESSELKMMGKNFETNKNFIAAPALAASINVILKDSFKVKLTDINLNKLITPDMKLRPEDEEKPSTITTNNQTSNQILDSAMQLNKAIV